MKKLSEEEVELFRKVLNRYLSDLVNQKADARRYNAYPEVAATLAKEIKCVEQLLAMLE